MFSIYGSKFPTNQFVFGKIIMEISFKFLWCIQFGCFGNPILRSLAWPLFFVMVSGHAVMLHFGHNRSMEQTNKLENNGVLTCQPSQPMQLNQVISTVGNSRQDSILCPIEGHVESPTPQKQMIAIDCTLKDRNIWNV